VLILGGLQERLLILLDFKSFMISDLIKNEGFAEVLILGGLGCAVGTDVWDRAGDTERGPPTRCGRRSEPLRGRAGRKWCSERMPHRSTRGYCMSIYIYTLAFECFSNALTGIVDSERWGCDFRGERIEAVGGGRGGRATRQQGRVQ
jgi:hypothetical protein